MSFFIFGRPRSRTAWCANFLTYGTSFCMHEPFADHTPQELQREFNRYPARSIGAADTSLIHNPYEILALFPQARLVMLTGTHDSWRRFANSHSLSQELILRVENDYQRTKALLEQTGRCAFVNAHSLMWNAHLARNLWAHCTGSDNMDEDRYKLLSNFNVQVTPESLQARLASALPRR